MTDLVVDPPKPLSLTATKELLAKPKTMDMVFDHVANGGTLVSLANKWNITFARLARWVNTDDDRAKLFKAACNSQREYWKERVIDEYKNPAFVDIRGAYNPDGSLKSVLDMPEDIRRAIAAVDVEERIEGRGADAETIRTSKLKLIDKLKALEMLGKGSGLFAEQRVEIGVTLADLLEASRKPRTIEVKQE